MLTELESHQLMRILLCKIHLIRLFPITKNRIMRGPVFLKIWPTVEEIPKTNWRWHLWSLKSGLLCLRKTTTIILNITDLTAVDFGAKFQITKINYTTVKKFGWYQTWLWLDCHTYIHLSSKIIYRNQVGLKPLTRELLIKVHINWIFNCMNPNHVLFSLT